MKDMELLFENWRKYSALIESREDLGKIFLFENKAAIEKDFSILLEDFDSGKISGEELYDHWHKSMLYEHKMLNERIGDTIRRAGRAIKGAWERLNDWVLTKSIQLAQMAKRGVEKTVVGAKKLIEKAADFKSEHPLAFKVVTVVAIGIVMFGFLSAFDRQYFGDSPIGDLFPGQAQAAIKAPQLGPGGMTPGPLGEISEQAYEAARGLLHQSGLDQGKDLEFRAESMKLLDAFQQSDKVHDLSQIKGEYGQFVNKQVNLMDGFVKLAREGDEEVRKYIEYLVKLSEKTTYKIGGIPTR